MAVERAETVSTLDAALSYVARGWAIVPIPRGQKAPLITGWPNLRLTKEELPAHFSAGENIGLILGEASDGLIDVDLDVPEAASVAKHFLPTTAPVSGRMSKPASHR